MLKKKPKISWEVILLIFIVILIVKNYDKQDNVDITYNYYDAQGNQIDPSSGRQSIVNGTTGIAFISVTTTVRNSGDLTLTNVRISSASPAALNAAYGTRPNIASLAPGSAVPLTSGLINVTQFEGQLVDLSVTITGNYTTGEGVPSTITYTGTARINVQPDSPVNCPNTCSGSNILFGGIYASGSCQYQSLACSLGCEQASVGGTELLSNPSFDTSTGGWTYYKNTNVVGTNGRTTTAGEYDTAPGAYKIGVTTTGTVLSDIQFYTSGLSITAGKQYLLSYRVKGSNTGTMELNMMKSSSPYTFYSNYTSRPVRSISTSWTTQQVLFTSTVTASDTRITFYMGNSVPSGGYILLDTISFTEIVPTTIISRCIAPPATNPSCGDNYCTTGEATSCPTDCAYNNKCGNGICDNSTTDKENKDNCPYDCWVTSADYRTTARDMGIPYHTYDQIKYIMQSLQIQYPNLVSSEVIGQTVQGKNIYMYKIGNPSGGRFMWDGRGHGMEDCGTESGLAFVQWALNSNSTDAQNVRTKNYLLFIPGVNIDSTRRQNMRRVNPDSTTTMFGIDLNRNFVTGWGGSGTSDRNSATDYRGSSAGSEPETQAVRYAMQTYLTTDGYSIYMNTHCGMKMLNYYSNTATTQRVLANIATISSATGATTLTHYPPGQQTTGGYFMADGATYTGGNGWIHETIWWSGLPPTLGEYLNIWYFQDFPIWLGMAQAVQK